MLTGNSDQPSPHDTTVKLNKRPFYELHYGFSPTPIAPYQETYNLRDNRGDFKPVKTVIPASEKEHENGLMQIFFRGGKADEPVLLFIADYQSTEARIYVDHNQDYDFTNDGAPLKLQNDSIEIYLSNHENKAGKFKTRLQRMTIQDEETRNNWKKNITYKPAYSTMELTAPDFWFRELRHNIISADVQLDDTQFQIGLMDYNLNGLYNDPEDKILVGDYQADTLSTDLNDNNYKVSDNTPFAVGNLGYKITSIDPAGTSISFEPIDFSEVPSRISEGSDFPDITIETLEKETINLKEQIIAGQYNYIEFWGTWCKGCVEEIPNIKAAHEKYQGQLNIIGLHSGSSGAALKKFIEKKGIDWTQFVASDESLKTLKVSGFPYGILINPEGKIEAFNVRIEDVIKLID